MNCLPILALPCLLAMAASPVRANEWLRATTAIENQSKRTWTLEGRSLPATFIVATAGNGREETTAYTDTLTHTIADGQEIQLRLADPTRSVEAWFTLRDHAGQAPFGPSLVYRFAARSTSCWTSCCVWRPQLATLGADWGLKAAPEDVLTAATAQKLRVTGNQWPEVKEPTLTDHLITVDGMGPLH